ncbi:phosphotransferase family protein [Nocardioides sp. TRM66260-LWL]|uniref:phosphotransferase family protein n=1 Tax=Nocardioides sp. TRM66260-LWL TaxID=2874478 RepID=UPI001CC4214C|nr:phosphotransferase family protein [Nocardioides sp. TRM66260-LWL]MBZ5735976.1 phosphotransferase family protein [Nocardioides sp. TRM66260-LWL]
MSLDLNPAGRVRDEDAFDVATLTAWLATALDDADVRIDDVRQFRGGASNLTYALEATTATGPRSLILRRPPAGRKAAGAHDMGREHRIQAALAPVFGPIAPQVGHCADASVLGSEFYVMERVPGVILRAEWPGEPDELGPATPERADALCQEALDVLVALHGVDVASAPDLAALSRGPGYVERQVSGWISRLDGARTDDTGDWSDVLAWVRAHQPDDVTQVVVHNDFRFDNLVLDAATPDLQVRAVLDWELATVGDPLMDLSSTLAYWVQGDDDELFQLFRRQPTHLPGMWTRAELVDRYAAATGRVVTPEHALFLEVFGLFRLAVIAQQIWYRYVHRQTTNESYAVMGQVVAYLEQRCRRLAGLGSGPTSGPTSGSGAGA